VNTDKIGELLTRGADEIDYGALEDELLEALALQTDKPLIATRALGEMERRLEILFAGDPEAARREMSRLHDRLQLEQQTIELARQMRDAVDRYDDPDMVAQREAYERAKAERIGARLASFYVKSGQRDGDEPLDLAIAKMLRYFAHRVDAEVPEVGNAPTVDQPLPTLESGALVWLDLVSAPSGRELVLRIKTPDGKTTKSELLVRGTKLRIITYLESPSRPSDLIAAIDELSAAGRGPA
jgi:hypothetical protein